MIQRVLVTGGAGFIGFHVCRRLLSAGYDVVTLDNVNDYYDTKLKYDRLEVLKKWDNFHFHKIELADRPALENMYAEEGIGASDKVIHLAAQAGVRYSLKNPDAYINGNIVGTYNLLELSRKVNCPHFMFASSSSVYGNNAKVPFAVEDNVDHPISLYAATKKSTELLAHVYAYSYGLPVTGLRFFTVYGPWGRPDMSLFIFTRAILAGTPVPVFNYGDMERDFTYIDDIVEGIVRLKDQPPVPDPAFDPFKPNPASSWLPYRIYNIGNHHSVKLLDFIAVLEQHLGRKAVIDLQPIQMGDVQKTYADVDALMHAVGFKPKTTIEEGIPSFLEWYREYYKVEL